MDKKILLSIARIIGKPIAIDQKTLDHDVGNYAVVLIDIDFAKSVPTRIRLKANGKEFWQYVEIQDMEKINFCTHCKFMGHKFENCLAARKILGGPVLYGASFETRILNQKCKEGSSEALKSEGHNQNSKYAWKEVKSRKKNMHGNKNLQGSVSSGNGDAGSGVVNDG